MGTRGPTPKRSTQRRRRNEPAIATETGPAVVDAELDAVVAPPAGNWHKVAVSWYESLATSGQSAWYTPSDWMTAYVAAEALSRELNPKPFVIPGKGIERRTAPISGAAMSSFLHRVRRPPRHRG